MNLDNYLALFDYDPTNSYKSRGKLSEDSNGPGTVDIKTTKLTECFAIPVVDLLLAFTHSL